MWSSIFRHGALLLITAALVWALVLGWWRSNEHSPTGGESLLYLVALPLALFGGFVFIHAFLKHLRTPAPPLTAEAGEKTPQEDTAALARDAQKRRYRWAVLTTAICAPGATDIHGLIDAARQGKTPQPDDRLKDDEGFPVFTARIKPIDAHLQDDHLDAFNDTTRWPAACTRNLAIANDVLTRIVPEVSSLLETDAGRAFHLSVRWLTDASYSLADRDALCDWLRQTHFAAIDPARLEITIEFTNDAIAPATDVATTSEATHAAEQDTLILLLASSSAISESDVRRWQAEGRLFTPGKQQAQVPGECGAALVYTTGQCATRLGLGETVLMSRPNAHARDKSADAPGRISADLCARLCAELLDLFDIPRSQVGALVSDSDHRSTRQAEALGVLDETFERLEPSNDFLPLGTVTGSAAPASALLTLACAVALCLETDAPVLALSLQHPTRRAAMLFMPSPGASPTSPSA